MLLEGKRGLVLGIANKRSIAWGIAQAAHREGARLAVTPSCAMCGNQYPSDGDITAAINTALDASALDHTKVEDLQILRNQELNPSSTIIERGVIISFNYPFQLFLPFTPIGLSNYTLSAQVQMREEK